MHGRGREGGDYEGLEIIHSLDYITFSAVELDGWMDDMVLYGMATAALLDVSYEAQHGLWKTYNVTICVRYVQCNISRSRTHLTPAPLFFKRPPPHEIPLPS